MLPSQTGSMSLNFENPCNNPHLICEDVLLHIVFFVFFVSSSQQEWSLAALYFKVKTMWYEREKLNDLVISGEQANDSREEKLPF